MSSHNAKPEQKIQSPAAFFCKAGRKQKADSSTGLERQFPPVTPHCLRKWTRHMNEQCRISLVPVHFCNSCVYEYVTAKSNLHIRALPGNLLTKRSYLKLKIDSCQFSSRYFLLLFIYFILFLSMYDTNTAFFIFSTKKLRRLIISNHNLLNKTVIRYFLQVSLQ